MSLNARLGFLETSSERPLFIFSFFPNCNLLDKMKDWFVTETNFKGVYTENVVPILLF